MSCDSGWSEDQDWIRLAIKSVKILMPTENELFSNDFWNTVFSLWHNLWCFLSILLRWSYKMKNLFKNQYGNGSVVKPRSKVVYFGSPRFKTFTIALNLINSLVLMNIESCHFLMHHKLWFSLAHVSKSSSLNCKSLAEKCHLVSWLLTDV